MPSLFDIFSRDPSKHWPAPREAQLSFDVSSRSLNGIAIGTPFESLREIGRPDNKNPFRCEDFAYDRLGFSIGGEHGKVTDFCLMFDPSIKKSSRTSPLQLMLVAPGGANITVERGTQPGEIQAVLGDPAEIEADDDYPDEPDHLYHFPKLQLLFCFDKDGLVTLDVDPRD